MVINEELLAARKRSLAKGPSSSAKRAGGTTGLQRTGESPKARTIR